MMKRKRGVAEAKPIPREKSQPEVHRDREACLTDDRFTEDPMPSVLIKAARSTRRERR